MKNSITPNKSTLKIYQRVFFLVCFSFLGLFAMAQPLYSQGVPSGKSGGISGVFENSSKGTTQADEAKANQFMSDILWWIRRIAVFMCIVIFVISAVMYATGKAPINVILPAMIACALVGGGIEIASGLFFDVGSEAAGR